MTESTTEAEIVITRSFDAQRGRVWNAWTEPGRLMRWWLPEGFTSPACEIDLRVGGVIEIEGSAGAARRQA